MGICKLCRTEKELIKAHIYPRKLYEPIRDAYDCSPSEKAPRIYEKGTEKSEQIQCGIYDTEILCSDCDNGVFGTWDTYGQNFLKTIPERATLSSGQRFYHEIESYDYGKLKLFFMSIAWRAAITKHKVFKQITLGPWEKKLREMLLLKNSGTPEEFSVFLYRFTGLASEIVTDPDRVKIGNVNCLHFRIPLFGFFVKTDQRKFGENISRFILKPNQKLIVLALAYKESIQFRSIASNWFS